MGKTFLRDPLPTSLVRTPSAGLSSSGPSVQVYLHGSGVCQCFAPLTTPRPARAEYGSSKSQVRHAANARQQPVGAAKTTLLGCPKVEQGNPFCDAIPVCRRIPLSTLSLRRGLNGTVRLLHFSAIAVPFRFAVFQKRRVSLKEPNARSSCPFSGVSVVPKDERKPTADRGVYRGTTRADTNCYTRTRIQRSIFAVEDVLHPRSSVEYVNQRDHVPIEASLSYSMVMML